MRTDDTGPVKVVHAQLGVLLCLPFLVAACGTETAPTADASPSAYISLQMQGSPSSGQPSPEATPTQTQPAPFPTKLPSRPPVPESAYQQITVARLDAPESALRAPGPGNAQVILACDYEEWSLQYETNLHDARLNPPGQHPMGDQRGDYLNARTSTRSGEALGNHGDPVAAGYIARSYTEDSWPQWKLVTAFEVQRRDLTRKNVLGARNQYAIGCSAKYVPTLLDAVRVSIYAPWDWKI
ncbi:hypothetical protein EV643_13219 [Kribbella sp. VKM Ac-2527]|uniref:Uncharacterized protein n=1 Tax=Kribbella caucasensis TaxID=2512215 RepID=A0A4R6JCI7_9ACTN|nr:hypothetical protein [Kribbella sp. VKM Ac-2527]TDO33484.1 hypothetical protein EV643_13219 [Kribbella sp. VKM Ac-2527]